MPNFAKEGDSGFDLRANISGWEPIVIPAGKIGLIPTGLFFEIPPTHEMQVRPRSGLALKSGVTVLNTPGTVDSGYRGEVKIIMYNTGAFGDFIVNHGDRIAQGVICPVNGASSIIFEIVSELSDSERGSGGFGHSGV